MLNDTISSNKFICSLCNKSFTTKNGLKKHSTKKIPCNDKEEGYEASCP
jgi:hypothetical protein